MVPRLIGNINFAPKDPQHPDLWQLEEPFAQVTRDGYIIICRPWKRTDGASIPDILWGLLGHPFEDENTFWSIPHDQGYHGEALVLDLTEIKDVQPEALLIKKDKSGWLYEDFDELHKRMPRKWFDRSMRSAMDLMRERRWKQCLAYAGVRSFGWKSWLVDTKKGAGASR